MAVFVPFMGFRYNVENSELKNYVCPPYDIISPAERAELIKLSPDNIVSVELPEGGDNRYQDAASHLAKMLASNRLKADHDDSFYIYQMRFDHEGKETTLEGIVGRLRLEPLDGGVVLPHENTLSKAKDDRLNLMKATAANISSVYSLFSDADRSVRSMIDEALKKSPAASVFSDGVTHSIYPISGTKAKQISEAFRDKSLFIADGHHRYETGLNYKAYREELGEIVDDSHPANYIMMTCVPIEHPGLVVFPTHRVINKRDGFDGKALLKKCEGEFAVTGLSKEESKKALQTCYENNETAFLFYDGAFSLLTRNPGTDFSSYMPGRSDAYRNLDVSVLHSVILAEHLGIDQQDMASGKSLLYTRDFDEAVALVDEGKASCAFLINPTRVSEIAAVALDGERMPQKSTYFYPKLITGLVINKM